MVIGGRDITSIPSEYFNPSHLGARNDVFSPDLNLTQLETPLQGRITQHQTEVPTGSGFYPQIRLFAVPGSCWFLSYPQIRSMQSSDLPSPSLNLKTSLYILWPLLVSGLNCKACLYNRWIQYSQPGAVTTNIRISGEQALDSTKVSRLITPPHWRKTRRLQVGHNIFCWGQNWSRRNQCLKVGKNRHECF
ncbi:hypothetical protein YC2023_071545 [Brassica napus]